MLWLKYDRNHLTLVPQAMASFGQAPVGKDGGLGILHTHCPAASNSGASEKIVCERIFRNFMEWKG